MSFWHLLLYMWHLYKHHVPQNVCKVQEQLVHFNSHILINGKPMVQSARLPVDLTVGQLWKGDAFSTFLEVKDSLSISIPRYRYFWLILVIPDTWRFMLKMPGLLDDQVIKLDEINNQIKVLKWVYDDKICDLELSVLLKVASTWNKKLDILEDTKSYKKNFGAIYKCCQVERLPVLSTA